MGIIHCSYNIIENIVVWNFKLEKFDIILKIKKGGTEINPTDYFPDMKCDRKAFPE